jgi:uncharacterized membrane protein YhaH (DUF805 family)
MSSLYLFHVFIAGHIMSGAIGLVSFWVPVIARKGGAAHRYWGRIFTILMLVTGGFAIGISTMTIIDPGGTHPHLATHPEFRDIELIRCIFGWMMLYLAILTLNLTWYGWLCISNRRAHHRNREWHNLALQALLMVAAVNCVWQGWQIGQPLMLGIAMIGFATVGTNLWFLYKPVLGQNDWLLEHIKALVGAGISVYTAFFAFGAVRTIPELGLNPVLWAVPLTVGIALILYHWRQVGRATQRLSSKAGRLTLS